MVLGLLHGQVLGQECHGIDYAAVFVAFVVRAFGQLGVKEVETFLHFVDMRKRLPHFLQQGGFVGQ